VAFAFLLGLAAVARWGAGLVGRLLATPDDELLTVCFVGVAVLLAGLAEELGVSEAIGAFMAGLVFAESAVAERVERVVLPLRDAFAAIFFFAFGLRIDPGDAGRVAGAVGMTVLLNITAGVVAARMHDFARRPAAAIELTALGRGVLILAALAAGAGLDEQVGPFVALYVLILAVAGPILAGRSADGRFLPARLFPSSSDRAATGRSSSD
jgi:CPA2 family monovalent cation:H+ antiporter-2